MSSEEVDDLAKLLAHGAQPLSGACGQARMFTPIFPHSARLGEGLPSWPSDP